MAGRRTAPAVDYVILAEFLGALAYPARLELLDLLHLPHTLGEIRLTPRRHAPGENPDRSASRQAILRHLDKLVEADLVHTEPTEQAGRTVPRYQVNPAKLYALTEELRRVSVRHAGHGPAGDATGTLAGDPGPAEALGPRLVLVHGVYEGKAFSLDPRGNPERRWVVGRRRGLQVMLDYDPYVSLENAVLSERSGTYTITDLPGSKNGTSVNWTRLPGEGSRRLRAGDVIGVGRSLLSFIPE